MSGLMKCVLCVCVFVLFKSAYSESSRASVRSNLEKYWWKNSTMSTTERTTMQVTSPSYKFPTATWSAVNYEEQRKMFRPETSKLYLFKPSPFLKPPFTEGDVGASISGIEYGVDIMGRRSGKPKRISSDRRIGVKRMMRDEETDMDFEAKQLDRFLEYSLGKYLKSSNLSDIFGSISIDTFSEALKRVLEEKRSTMPPYDQNKELRRKFRDEVLFPKKSGLKLSGGVREKQYQKRLKKTWEIIKDNPVQQKLMVLDGEMVDVSAPDDEGTVNDFDDFEATYPSFTEEPSMKQAAGTKSSREQDIDNVDATYSSIMKTSPVSSDMSVQLWEDETNNRNYLRYTTTTTETPTTAAEDMRHYMNPQDFESFDSTTDVTTMKPSWGDSSRFSHELSTDPELVNERTTTIKPASINPSRMKEVPTKTTDFANVKMRTTDDEIRRANLAMPTKMYRGRTKYRDTVTNTLDDEFVVNDDDLKLTVAESTYYRPRVSPVSSFTYQEEAVGAIPGKPGEDYPIYSSPPRANGFRCPRLLDTEQKMMADHSTRCQVFYICRGNAPPSPVLCPNGTVFNEDVLVCDWWYNVDC